MQLDYKEQLADARWLKKRNEILERDNYTCQKCGATSHLNVHHLYYEKGRLAWEYPNEKLVTLCDGCHREAHSINKPIIGCVYEYNHSDYTNYMVCYAVNENKKEVYLLGVDDGSSVDSIVFICVSFEHFSNNFILLKDFWSNCYSDENYWQEVIIRILVKMSEGKKKELDLYTYGYTYKDENVYNYARHRIKELINTNEVLYCKFNDILNEQ